MPITLPRPGRRTDRDLEPTMDVAAVELTSRTLVDAAAEMAARFQTSISKRAAARRPSLKSDTARRRAPNSVSGPHTAGPYPPEESDDQHATAGRA
ncbi:hypothetical protein ACFXB3_02310 [Streptomyces sp. NPDC059447]|uniref:hypothetical protein n=1 Tax=Streptomyces sp. NPDC059447 TaxID=3346834 RepID=UPI0036773773